MIETLDLLSWEPPASRRTDPETCETAAKIAGMRASFNRLRVLALLIDGPLTDFELAAKTGVQQTSIGKRRGECKDHGLVEALRDDSGKVVTRPSPTRSPSTVWAITDKGRQFYLNQKSQAAA
jgi:DNA-binding transcriptional ArsR family regulator